MKKKLFPFLIFIAAFFIVIFGGFITLKILKSPVVSDKNSDLTKISECRIEIPYGMSLASVSNLLKEKNLIRNEKIFYYSARIPQFRKFLFPKSEISNFSLKSGVYYIKNNMEIPQILELLTSGRQEYIKISIPEGFTISKIAELLQENRICSKEDFVSLSKNNQLLEEYKIPAASCEGYLFPDTYFFTAGMTAETVITNMLDNFFEKIKMIDGLSEQDPEELFYTVRLASVVEREYRVKEEAPLIASVFKNRLARNIGLYSCATVVYILTEIQGLAHPERILIQDTKIDSPYNTYKYAGLPPGAISNPGFVALNACVNTPKTNYYYFQVADAQKGTHVFTTSFEEHIEKHNLVSKKAAK